MGISASAALIVYRAGSPPFRTEKHFVDDSGNRIEYTPALDVVPTVRIRHLDTRTPTIEVPIYIKKKNEWIVNAHASKREFRIALGQRNQLFEFESRCGFQ